jgi:cell division protein FtsB
MRLITLALVALLLLIQIPLWFGKGGWLRVSQLQDEVAAAQIKTEEKKARNAKLDSEVRDLKDGTGAVEERARYELGMIKQNEVFIQILDPNDQPKESATPLPPPPPPKPDAKQ